MSTAPEPTAPEATAADSAAVPGSATARTVAFIGLGVMGGPMAANLVRHGHRVIGFNRSRPAVDRLVAAGGEAAAGVADAVREAEIVFTMLPDSPDVESVVLGADGVLAQARPGTRVIDMSTIRPDVARRLAEAGAERGIPVLDAPVSGGEAGAKEGVLSVMVGGTPEDFAAVRPVLAALGTTIVHVGPAGSGQTVKAANQLITAGNLQMLAEALVFLEAHEVDTASALEVIGGGLAGSTILARKGAAMRERNFQPGFRAELHHKDLGIVQSAARDARLVLPLTALVAQLIAALNARGEGHLDHSALVTLVETFSGRRQP